MITNYLKARLLSMADEYAGAWPKAVLNNLKFMALLLTYVYLRNGEVTQDDVIGSLFTIALMTSVLVSVRITYRNSSNKHTSKDC